MRHRVSHRKLGRVTEHRIAMLRNQARRCSSYEHIETTMPKAKELRPFVERIITIAKRGLAAGDANARTLHARRLVLRDIQDRDVVEQAVRHDCAALRGASGRLHAHPAARLSPRRQRRGRADRARRQRVRPQRRKPTKAKKAEAKKPKGVGGRLRAAAERLRGKKAEAGDGEAAEGEAPAKKAKPARSKSKGAKSDTRGKAKTTAAPRKAGGSLAMLKAEVLKCSTFHFSHSSF